MRIRRRPSSLLSSLPLLPSLAPDLSSSHQVLPPNGTAGTKYNSSGIKGGLVPHQPAGKQGDQGLHPAGNLPADSNQLSEEHKSRNSKGDDHSDPHQNFVNQVVKDEVKEEELKIEMEDSKDIVHQVNNNKRINGNSGALVLVSAASQKRRNGGLEDNVPVITMNSRRAKPRTARRGGGASSLSNNCTGVNGSDNESCNNTNEAAEKSELLVNGSSVSNNGSKRRRSPAVLMEGSRCSRVNGRGWRCCQQTLVGYSLCEHHLGKGRLRSMNSVRGQLGTSKLRRIKDKDSVEEEATLPSPLSLATSLSLTQQEEQQQDVMVGNKKEEEEVKIEIKKMKKLGNVKARSISSLLEPTSLTSASLVQQMDVAPSDNEAMV